jgi:hypothetical protein
MKEEQIPVIIEKGLSQRSKIQGWILFLRRRMVDNKKESS